MGSRRIGSFQLVCSWIFEVESKRGKAESKPTKLDSKMGKVESNPMEPDSKYSKGESKIVIPFKKALVLV